jgi:hypothetical protein
VRARFEFTLITLAAAVFSLGSPAVQAASFTINPSADAFVTTGPTGNLSGENYGGAGALSVAASGLANGEFQSVMQFSTSAAFNSFNTQFGVGQWTIQSVTLQLTATPNNNAIFNTTAAGQFNVTIMLNNSWTEGTGTPAMPTTDGITYNTLRSTYIGSSDQAAGTFSFNGASSGSAPYSLTLGSALLGDIYNGNNVSTLLSAADSGVSMLVNSRSGGSSSSHPELIINVIPEPGSLTLVLLGLIMIAGTRWSVSRYCSR